MTTDSSSGPGSSFNPAIAVPSRTYAAFRGASKDAFPADREAASELRKALDGMQVDEVIRENAAALVRAVDFLAQEHLQFADLGGGRPMQGLDQRKLPDLCQVAIQRQPERRWLLLDSDITVVIAGRALIGGAGVAVVQEDLRSPAEVVYAMDEHLDLGKRIVVILGAVLHFLTTEEVHALMSELWACLTSGSVVAATHLTSADADPAKVAAGVAAYQANHGIDIYPRTRDEITALADPFVIRDPGVVSTIEFKPDPVGPTPVPAPHFLMWLADRP